MNSIIKMLVVCVVSLYCNTYAMEMAQRSPHPQAACVAGGAAASGEQVRKSKTIGERLKKFFGPKTSTKAENASSDVSPRSEPDVVKASMPMCGTSFEFHPEHSAHVNFFHPCGHTVLMHAIQANCPLDVLEEIVSVPGCDVNATNRYQQTALMIAASCRGTNNRDHIGRLLSIPGINIEKTDCKRWNALTYALMSDNRDAQRMILGTIRVKMLKNAE